MTIYEKYGGYDFFHQCIYGLYLEMFDHPEIAYHFIGVDLEWLSRQQTHYLIRAIGGPDLYEGGNVKEVHARMGITKFQYAEIAIAFRQVFLDRGVSKEDTAFIMNFVASHAPDIITRKTSLIDQIMRPIYRTIRKLFGWIRSSKTK
ncbi:group I truncated hemoglobin [Peredibacter starrii]|uniref:Group 1 truncated hemoglobin n=1 Tax=Peredibacter starrii TaxID=28202 RepID=A0AAX4HJ94_9BACT|nr:group 1 truncated hemoglobin [Peredibacter starrii]WPU63303.1 group 1 truncated hemoglobin [Peredibacter starrii]